MARERDLGDAERLEELLEEDLPWMRWGSAAGELVLPQSRALELAASGSRRRIDDKTPLTLGGKREALPHILAGELGERLEQVFHGYACG